jgi:hypothetical protein
MRYDFPVQKYGLIIYEVLKFVNILTHVYKIIQFTL